LMLDFGVRRRDAMTLAVGYKMVGRYGIREPSFFRGVITGITAYCNRC
jgi:hypothetical protein